MEKIKRIKPKRNGSRVVFMCRLSYVHLDAPWSGRQDNEKKYTVSCIIPKDDKDTIDAVKAAIDEALTAGVPQVWKGVKPNLRSSNFKYPLKDGDDERPDDEAYAGAMFLSASSKTEVPVLNRLKERISPNEAYSGCYAMVSVNFFAFSKGSNGVAAGLNAVLKYADGERLGGAGDGSRDFDSYDFGVDESLSDL